MPTRVPRRSFPLTVSVFSAITRRRRRRLPRLQLGLAPFGHLGYDLRGAVMDEPEATIVVLNVFGNCSVVLPPSPGGELDGLAVFGTHLENSVPHQAASGPHVRVVALTVFGSTLLVSRGRRALAA